MMQSIQSAPRRRGHAPGGDGASATAPRRPELLGHLVQLALDEEQTLDEIRRLNDRSEAACRHLATPGEDATLSLVLLGNLRLRYCGALDRLQANRLEVGRLLDGDGPRG
jgi:hypothetical protein